MAALHADAVRLVEVGPRDGLQNEKAHLSTGLKIALIERLRAAGLNTIEAGAFVSPKWVPQMAGSAEVLAALNLDEAGMNYPVLVPNMQGFEAAKVAGVKEIALFTAASESFVQKNINCSIAESFERFAPVVQEAYKAGIRVRGYLSCVNGCPYEGDVPPAMVAKVARSLMQLGCYEISLGDTIGVGTPKQTKHMLDHVLVDVPAERLAVHFHDTYGQALANILLSLEKGIRVIDSSVGGLGGCPYAPGAAGNVATEDVLYMLHGMGLSTGVDLMKVVDTAWWVSQQLGYEKPNSKVAQALKGKVCPQDVA